MAATLVFRLTGGASNTTPGASLGGIMSNNAVATTAINNLFDDVSPVERISGMPKEYRAIDVYNSGDATAESVALYMSIPTTSASTELHFGFDTTGNDHVAEWVGPTIVNDTTDPASPTITFAERTTETKLVLPNIPVAKAIRVWIKRIVTAGGVNMANDGGVISVDYA